MHKLKIQVVLVRELFFLLVIFIIIFNNIAIASVVNASKNSFMPQIVNLDIENEIICPICTVDSNLDFITRCNHSYCSTCITKWFKIRPICPICKGKISNDIYVEYSLNKHHKNEFIGLDKNALISLLDNSSHKKDAIFLSKIFTAFKLGNYSKFFINYIITNFCQKNRVDIKNVEKIVHFDDILTDKYQSANRPTDLYFACIHGFTDIVKNHISKRTSLNILFSISGYALIHVACINGNLDIIKLLFANGANINLKTKYGDHLLHLACAYEHFDIVQFLITKGVDVNVVNNFGKSPIHIACSNGHLIIVLFLIEKRVNLNVMNKYGKSALYLAHIRGYSEIVKALIENGADAKIGDMSL